MENKDLEKICFNCGSFLPSVMNEYTEFGICLNDEEFEPFIDELLENSNYECCQNLIEQKKFSGEQEACSDFNETESIEIDANDEFVQKLIAAVNEGQINNETLKNLILDEYVKNIDLATFPVEQYTAELHSSRQEEQDSAISSLGALCTHGNKKAFEELFKYFQKLQPPKTIEDVHFKINIFDYLKLSEDDKESLLPFLINELYNTPSNNTTRQWISSVLEFFKSLPQESVREPLEKMLRDKRFSYRYKQKIKDILY